MTVLPDCQMPDGAEPCEGFKELYAENARLRKALKEFLNAVVGEYADHCMGDLYEPYKKARAVLEEGK